MRTRVDGEEAEGKRVHLRAIIRVRLRDEGAELRYELAGGFDNEHALLLVLNLAFPHKHRLQRAARTVQKDTARAFAE